NLTLRCDSLITGAYRASLFDGKLSYRPGLVDISSFSMNILGGYVSGNAALAKPGDDAYAVRGWFNIENIDIHNAFEVSDNFGQDYIKAENMEGNITGNISLSATADSNFRINSNDLVLNGEYTILNGSLINFEPAFKLSKFAEMEELERIDFSRLENDLIIRDGSVKIPRMDISSSAFNISLQGDHSFDGHYQYRLKVLLSEFLSKKQNDKVSEFGVIEDDGLGRTSLYLKIEGDEGGSKVSHDPEALRAGIKESLVREKQEIKSILNEEFGWYKGDSIHEVSRDKSQRFRIVWEETDSIKTQKDTSAGKKLPLINLFKKKSIKEGETGKK
ncbi:MAG: AsmA-like C-terminal region-containing protein, partial [Bacteroidales bacterium]